MKRGFTLLEVMIAMMLAGIALSGLLVLFGRATSASRYSRRATEATVLAQDQIEELRTSGAAGSGTTTLGPFTRTWNVVDGAAYDDLTVTVQWQDDDAPRSLVVRARRNR